MKVVSESLRTDKNFKNVIFAICSNVEKMLIQWYKCTHTHNGVGMREND